jgi:hypothetical protein
MCWPSPATTGSGPTRRCPKTIHTDGCSAHHPDDFCATPCAVSKTRPRSSSRPEMFADWLDPGTRDKADVQQMLDRVPEPLLTPGSSAKGQPGPEQRP